MTAGLDKHIEKLIAGAEEKGPPLHLAPSASFLLPASTSNLVLSLVLASVWPRTFIVCAIRRTA